MRDLTGGDYDDEYTDKPQPDSTSGTGTSDMRVSSDSPKCDDERDSEMEHPFKNEIEIKGFPVPYPMHGGYCGHGGAGWGGDGFGGGFGGGPGWQRCGFHRPIKDMMT